MARLLDREAEIETSYGGNFIDSIDGIEGTGRSDWFFYVNGYWSPLGAAETEVEGGDRIWWDHRYWQAAYRVPVVVGSWPAPFATGEGPVELDCHAPAPCNKIADRVEKAGGRVSESPEESPSVRVVAGLWNQILGHAEGKLLARGPGASGVYMETVGSMPIALDAGGEPAEQFSGLVAAVRRGERPPSWVVTGVTREALERAAASLDEIALADRYALAITADGERFSLPVTGR